jgi:flagellin-like hook-associated protein FlgL
MSVGDITLTASARANLAALQNTASLLQTTQEHLSTGKSVNSASDNATAYFASQGFLQRANDLTNVKNNLSTALTSVNSTTQSISDVTTLVQQLQGVTTQALGTTDTSTRAGLASQFNALLTQLDTLVNDATFNGTNLLNSTKSSLVVYFNETNTTALTVSGVNITHTGLNISSASNAFAGQDDINSAGSLLLTALSTLRTDAANFGGNATLIQTRQQFTSDLINNLQTASDNLVLADTNTEAANLQALQAQNQLGIAALNISGQQQQAILRLFP